MPKKKKPNLRQTTENPELDAKFALKTRQDLVDQDYLHKLNKEELAWLNKFNKEYVSADLDTKNLKKNLHNTKQLKKDCQDRNNSRNRDVLTRNKAMNTTESYEEIPEEYTQTSGYEENLIDQIYEDQMADVIDWLIESNDVYNNDKTLIENVIETKPSKKSKDKDQPLQKTKSSTRKKQ